MPKFSVLLTTYNRPQFIETAIKSVLDQTMQDFELIILDDDSDNKEHKKILKKYWNKPKVWILKSSVEKGKRAEVCRYARMINYGLKIATGDYIAYLCDDDFFMPRKLEVCANTLDSKPEIMVAYCKQKLIYVDENNIPTGEVSQRFADRILDEAAFSVDHSSVVHRREVYDLVGPWGDEQCYWNAADAEYWTRINNKGIVFHPINEELDAHVYHTKSYTNNNWEKLQ